MDANTNKDVDSDTKQITQPQNKPVISNKAIYSSQKLSSQQQSNQKLSNQQQSSQQPFNQQPSNQQPSYQQPTDSVETRPIDKEIVAPTIQKSLQSSIKESSDSTTSQTKTIHDCTWDDILVSPEEINPCIRKPKRNGEFPTVPCSRLVSIGNVSPLAASLDDMRKFASKHNIPGSRRMKKHEICEAIAVAKDNNGLLPNAYSLKVQSNNKIKMNKKNYNGDEIKALFDTQKKILEILSRIREENDNVENLLSVLKNDEERKWTRIRFLKDDYRKTMKELIDYKKENDYELDYVLFLQNEKDDIKKELKEAQTEWERVKENIRNIQEDQSHKKGTTPLNQNSSEFNESNADGNKHKRMKTENDKN